ncbi:MAG: response regulator, partial [Candidatus Eremiobacterota bacterium]
MPTEKIILVDGNKILGKAFSMSLISEGYSVILIDNGEDALSLATYEKPDLIIMDPVMSGMDGFEVCVKLKEKEVTSSIPVVFLSRSFENSHIEKAKELGVMEYLSKRQYTPLKLSDKVKQVFSKINDDKLRAMIGDTVETKQVDYVVEHEDRPVLETITVSRGDRHYVFTADEVNSIWEANNKFKHIEKSYGEIKEKFDKVFNQLEKDRKKATTQDKLIQSRREELLEAERNLKEQEDILSELNSKLRTVKWYSISEKSNTQSTASKLKQDITGQKSKISTLRQELQESQSKAAQSARNVAKSEAEFSSIEDEFKDMEKKYLNLKRELLEKITSTVTSVKARIATEEDLKKSKKDSEKQKVNEVIAIIEKEDILFSDDSERETIIIDDGEEYEV